LYQYAATQFNALTSKEKNGLFSSAAIQSLIAQGKMLDEDDLAYLRDGLDFRNVLLVEQPNKDWAYTVARSFLYDCFSYFFYSELIKSKDETLAAIAEKSLKEVTYHIRWSSEWVIRLGDGTEESHKRMQQAINDRWTYTGELVKMNEADKAMLTEGIGVDLDAITQRWKERVTSVTEEATLTIPQDAWMQEGGKDGRHTEHLGYILAELQFMQRAYPNMEW
jgi:ring-1,2-phenylacetyl-CoA epoxidase subunit PaaC